MFYVQSGEATFDVADEPDSSATESVPVGAGEVIRGPPGRFQEGYNDADNDEPVVGFAFGAPASKHDWTPSNRCCTAGSAARRPATGSR